MTNQYFTVSSSQMMIEVKKIINTLRKLRNDSRPARKLSRIPKICDLLFSVNKGPVKPNPHSAKAWNRLGIAAKIKKAISAIKKAALAKKIQNDYGEVSEELEKGLNNLHGPIYGSRIEAIDAMICTLFEPERSMF